MEYVIGIDGGGTKTRCVLGDIEGNILVDIFSGPSNHQCIGIEATGENIRGLFNKALLEASITRDKIKFVYLGLAGADLEEDFILLNSVCKPIFQDINYKIVNDVWIALRSGIKKNFGAVCICGTGSNAAAINKLGEKASLRALSYELGNSGGGMDIATDALHYAFKADEGIGEETLLTKYIPQIFNVRDMGEVLNFFYPEKTDVNKYMKEIPQIIFELSNKRDKVCQNILIKTGRFLGEMVSGTINRVSLEDEKVPIVLGGSIFKLGCNPLLLDEFIKVVHINVPKAYLVIPKYSPVVGAYLSALDELGDGSQINIIK